MITQRVYFPSANIPSLEKEPVFILAHHRTTWCLVPKRLQHLLDVVKDYAIAQPSAESHFCLHIVNCLVRADVARLFPQRLQEPVRSRVVSTDR